MDDSLHDFYISFPTKDLLWFEKHYLHECIPEYLNHLGINPSNNDTTFIELEVMRKELTQINSQPMEKLVIEELERHNAMIKNVNSILTDEQKNMCLRTDKKINQLKEWQPINETSKYLKNKLIKKLEIGKNYLLYGYTNIPEVYTYDIAHAKVVEYKINLLKKIAALEYTHSFIAEYKEKLELFEQHLKEDLTSLS